MGPSRLDVDVRLLEAENRVFTVQVPLPMEELIRVRSTLEN